MHKKVIQYTGVYEGGVFSWHIKLVKIASAVALAKLNAPYPAFLQGTAHT